MKLSLLLTGNELMSGDIIDSNSAMVAQILGEQGISVWRKVTIGDDYSLLVNELRTLSESSDVLIVNGGLGPTEDDLTAQALAEAMSQPLVEHPDAMVHVTQWCEHRGYAVNEASRKQAILPQGVTLVDNAKGSAPGFKIELNHCLVICTPGVPHELKGMLLDSILPEIQSRYGSHARHRVSKIQVFGSGESQLQHYIRKSFPDWPQALRIGFRASIPLVDVKVESDGQGELHDLWLKKLQTLLADLTVGEGKATLAGVVIDLLRTQGKKLVTAESCTGGLIASEITGIAGASDVFEAGFVTYSNRIKTATLNVDPALLEQQGAVSQGVVEQMLQGALRTSGADLGIAVSGVAGPGGGSPEKPVGLVWVAWGSMDDVRSQVLYFPGGRHFFQQLVCAVGLDLIRRKLLGIETDPIYFKQRKPPAPEAF